MVIQGNKYLYTKKLMQKKKNTNEVTFIRRYESTSSGDNSLFTIDI